MGELEPQFGDIEIVGTLGYAAQEPWVFSGTIRENILFGQPYEEHWYQEVLEACCLKEDVAELPHGDVSIVGERGVTLSGGQKARVTLARCIVQEHIFVYLLHFVCVGSVLCVCLVCSTVHMYVHIIIVLLSILEPSTARPMCTSWTIP